MTWRQFFFMALSVLITLNILGGWAWTSLPDGRLHLWFLDVGQGDAILMRLPAGEWVLVDGGPGSVVLDRLGRYMPFYDRELELVILTHPHADHVDGLVEVLARYRVNNLLLTGVKAENVAYERLLGLAEEKGVRLLYTENGRDLGIGWTGIDLLYPGNELRGKSIDNLNNSSIVFRLIYDDWIGFFSGDLEKDKEGFLLEMADTDLKITSKVTNAVGGGNGRAVGLPPNLSADLMKAGHHGSSTSNSREFVAAISPQTAVISCGVDNSFKHPHPGTLATFRALGVTVRRTDLEGTVEMVLP